MKRKLLFIITLLLCLYSYGQQSTGLRGNVINSATNKPIPGIQVIIKGQNQSALTDTKGEFYFISVASGEDVLVFSSSEIISKELPVTIQPDVTTSLKDVKLVAIETNTNLALVGISDESLLDDDESSSQEISSMVILSNDQYLSNVRYQLSPLRFKIRGYSNIYEQKYINGVTFNDQNRGVFNYASIGALNDLTRNGDVVNYHGPSTFTFGSIGGTENINMRAGNYAKGTKLTLSYTNRLYYLRGMASYSTGLQDNGWAFTAAVGGRYSDEGNVDGTFYHNFSYAIALEKQWNNGQHSLSFTTFGSPVERAQQSASYQEAYDLTGDNLYNPNWGWQNGKKRNSRIVKAYDPTAIVSHIWKINEKTTLTTGVGSHYARYGNTALNWYNAPDPRPDYYRYMPSYFSDVESVHDYYTELWKSKNTSTGQINWYDMYRANKLAKDQGEGALYIVEERRSDLFETSLNSTINTQISERNKLTAGVGIRTSQSKQFKTVDDLLGANYVLDVDKFAERDFPGNSDIIQNDLNRPDRKAYEGDIFGYDYRLNINSANIWAQNQYTTSLFDFYYGFNLSYTDFQRDGKMKNGRYENNSYGKGTKHSFVDFGVKAGLTYKITGRHLITGNISYATEAPLPNNAYISPRISDDAINNIESGKVFSADLNYIFSMPSLTGRISVFQTNFYDQISRISYYHDTERTFVNHTLSNMSKVNRGFELGVNYKINTNWNIDLAGTVAEYYYSNNPDGSISYENGKEKNIEEKVYLKNYYVGATPQTAGTLGINYFYDYWFLSANLNGFARNYIEIAPLRRLASNYSGINPSDEAAMEAYNILVDQERFGSGYTLDLSIGKVLYLSNNRAINLNFSFNNITNRRNIKTGGYEQGRLDITAPRKFASKYYYMQGINCFLNASYRF
ncbi:TonB-dependent receptor [Dysgonomonas macrotermitis]|uniref:CarboxypepD_reg-like domain-containing protein n=1 Tax=Dysgonomonas macrotermitis TaxID=1346286 RepID=A0A1M4WA48_9BACT|nr:TonB-dependent receptor [Dysgonomonas macrotermitis]SHE77953.1 CarboxypepD_reg-like domain-containing protein [Dysgonomonas macrotermitis]